VRKLQAGAGIAALRQFDSRFRRGRSTFTCDDPRLGHRTNGDIMTSRFLAAAALAVFTAACASGASIGQVKTNPGRYVDRNVTVRGTVTSSWGIPLLPLKMYQVDDGTGEILVVSDDRRIPSKGAQVKVTGKISEFAVFGGRSVGLHLRESDLDYSGR
jgi:hypothetical protein